MFMGDMGEGALREEKEGNCQTKKIKMWSLFPQGPDTKTNWPTDRRSQYNLSRTFVISLQITG
jgi:hypothetical protein